MVQQWHLFFLIACGIGAARSNRLECSAEDACFGYPTLCDPHSNCDILFKFDEQGNLDLQLTDFTKPNGFISFVVDQWPDHTLEQLVCIPNAQRRVRVVSRPGEKIQFSEKHMARYVRKLSDVDFKCTFLAAEIPALLKHQDSLIVSSGNYSDDMIIPEGQLVFKVESDEVYIHRISAAAHDDMGVLSVDEKKMTTDLIAKIGRIAAREGDDSDLEELIQSKRGSKRDEEDDLEDLLDSDKKYSTRRRQERKEKERRQKMEEEDEEDEEEDSTELKSKRGRGSRRMDDEDEDDEDNEAKRKPVKKGKRPTRRHPADDDAYEEDEDYEEGEEEEKKKTKKTNKKKGKGRKQKPTKSSDEEEYDDFATKEDTEDEDSNSSNHIAPLTVLTVAIYVMIH